MVLTLTSFMFLTNLSSTFLNDLLRVQCVGLKYIFYIFLHLQADVFELYCPTVFYKICFMKA